MDDEELDLRNIGVKMEEERFGGNKMGIYREARQGKARFEGL